MSISTEQLTQMRAAQAGMLPDTCTLLRGTATVNSIGEPVTAWGTVGTAIPCRVRPAPLQANVLVLGEQPITVSQWFVTMAHTWGMKVADRARMASGDLFEITEVQSEEAWITAARGRATRLE